MPNRRLWIGRINRRERTLFDTTFREDVLTALDPDHSAMRSGRMWRTSRPEELPNEWIFAQLGFETRSRRDAVRFDEESERFVHSGSDLLDGSFVLFVVDLRSQYVLFEEKRPDVPQASFVWAFTRLLNSGDARFDFNLIPDGREIEQWIASVDSVTRCYARVHKPNLKWRERVEAVRELVSAGEDVTVDVKALPAAPEVDAGNSVTPPLHDGGVDVNQGSFLRALLDHVSLGGNGVVRMSGVRNGGRSFFDSLTRLRQRQIRVDLSTTEEGHVATLVSILEEEIFLIEGQNGRNDFEQK
jgi:hypothetical protein